MKLSSGIPGWKTDGNVSSSRHRVSLRARIWPRIGAAFLSLVMTSMGVAAPVTLPARAVTYRPEVHAPAQVEAVAPLVLRTLVAARVQSVRVAPGQAVAAGQALVTLGGPTLESALSAARARSKAAQAELAAAQRSLASTRQTYGLTSDRKTLAAAEAALAAAEGSAATARSALAGLQAQRTVSSPSAARVSAVQAAPGAELPAGAALLTLAPRGALWLRAEWFDSVVPAPNTRARFVPAGGGPETQVRLAAFLPERAPDGARVLNFVPVGGSTWQAGETGELVWQGQTQNAVAVPAEALVLDAGRWYVLTDAAGRLAAQPVTPGPTRGADVLITRGLRPGQSVVVRAAGLLFHRDFAARYAPPD